MVVGTAVLVVVVTVVVLVVELAVVVVAATVVVDAVVVVEVAGAVAADSVVAVEDASAPPAVGGGAAARLDNVFLVVVVVAEALVPSLSRDVTSAASAATSATTTNAASSRTANRRLRLAPAFGAVFVTDEAASGLASPSTLRPVGGGSPGGFRSVMALTVDEPCRRDVSACQLVARVSERTPSTSMVMLSGWSAVMQAVSMDDPDSENVYRLPSENSHVNSPGVSSNPEIVNPTIRQSAPYRHGSRRLFATTVRAETAMVVGTDVTAVVVATCSEAGDAEATI